MRIGILSDTHDHLEPTRAALEALKAAGAEILVHCGDLCAPFMISELESAGLPVHVVWGNINDRYLTTRFADRSDLVTLHGEVARLELGEKRIAVHHYPDLAESLARSGDFDLVCYGHTHEKDLREVGSCVLLNPGEVMGRKGTRSVAIYDSETGTASFLDLPSDL